METKKATIKRDADQTLLILNVGETPLEIIITEDNPINVKATFNALLRELKKGLFNFDLADDKEDLYKHICLEYLTQLNTELTSIYQELQHYNLSEPV